MPDISSHSPDRQASFDGEASLNTDTPFDADALHNTGASPADPRARGLALDRARHEGNKLTKRLAREATRAMADYNMIEAGDRVMVCLSGGKDSYAMLDILLAQQKRAPFPFEIVAVNFDQKQPGFPAHVLPHYLENLGVPFHIETQDTYSIVKRLIPEGKTTCSLCSRLRRGVLYRVASELGATKIALGHHRDDILGTFFLNLFYAAKLKAMPPKLVSDDGKHTVIRPLAYVLESDLIAYAALKQFPLIPCDLCGSQENLKRKEVTRMIHEWDRREPGRSWSIFNALANVKPSHLMDRQLFDFVGLKPNGLADPDGDTAFDTPPIAIAADTIADAHDHQRSRKPDADGCVELTALREVREHKVAFLAPSKP
jgi:tRNA 2-thiocytidine biosynthesis protein TtcA